MVQSLQPTSVPGAICPIQLQHRYQKQLMLSLKVYLRKIEESLSVPLVFFLDKVENLDFKKRFSPALFSIYTHIKEGYDTKDLHLLFDTLQLFRNLNEEELYSLERTYSSILTERWEMPCIDELRGSTPHNESGELLSKEIRMLSLAHWDQNDFPPPYVLEAEKKIALADPDLWNEYETYVTGVKFFSGRVMEGATSPRFFGHIYLRLAYPSEDPILFYFEHLIHEVSHLHLFAMMGEDPMVLNSDTELFTSPIRVDKRPMMGIFHAAFVLARILRSLKTYSSINHVETSHFEKIEASFDDCLKTIGEHGRLTDAGRMVYESMQSCII